MHIGVCICIYVVESGAGGRVQRNGNSHGALWSTRTRGNIWRICVEGHEPVAGDQVMDEDEHLELRQLVPRARVHAVPKWRKGVRPRRHLHMHSTHNQKKDSEWMLVFFAAVMENKAASNILDKVCVNNA